MDREKSTKPDFGARVFKISHDERATDSLGSSNGWQNSHEGRYSRGPKGKSTSVYNGTKFTVAQEVTAGGICAIPGLGTHPGQGLGGETDAAIPAIQPVLNYAVDSKDNEIHICLDALRELEDEDPQLHVSWSEHLQEIRIQIMGEIQLEILQQILLDRFHLDIGFGEGSILYKETINQAVEGVGHFEPLRHYAEVHLLMQPAPRGSGLTFDANCSLEVLGKNWQHQVLSNLGAKEHLGVLTGSPIAI